MLTDHQLLTMENEQIVRLLEDLRFGIQFNLAEIESASGTAFCVIDFTSGGEPIYTETGAASVSAALRSAYKFVMREYVPAKARARAELVSVATRNKFKAVKEAPRGG